MKLILIGAQPSEITVTLGGIRSGTPHELFTAPIYTATVHNFDVTFDGQRFVLLLSSSLAENSVRLTIVTNWQSMLAK